jgi:hypothetical protein
LFDRPVQKARLAPRERRRELSSAELEILGLRF